MWGRKLGRRTFLRIAAAGAASAAIEAAASEADDMTTNRKAPEPRGGAIFAYGYHEAPYKLDSGPHPFVDWRYVNAGRVRWQTPTGEAPLWAYEEIKEVEGVPERIPYGLRLVAQPAEKIGPVIGTDRDWEFMIYAHTMLDLGGKYGLWYEALPPKDYGAAGLLCYAESADGITWTKPNLGLVEFAGSRDNNIVIDGSKCPYGQFHGNSVFVDPNAPPEERFKVIYWSKNVPDEVIARLKQENPESVDPFGESNKCGVLLGTSPDGLHWTLQDKLLFCHTCDTQTVAYYDSFLRRYVLFTRSFQFGRRSIARSETADVTRWPVPEVVLWTPVDSDPSDDLYLNSKTVYPGTRTVHLMFPTVYRRRADNCVIRAASSPDGIAWQWLPGEVLQTGREGEWDGGCVFPGCGLTEISGDRVALPFAGYRYPHKYPRFGRVGQFGLAVWPKERLVALQADEEAEFWTPAMILPGDSLYLNFETSRAGYIKVAVEGVEGRTLDDCDALFGNELKKQVTWEGNPSMGIREDQKVLLRFKMRSAKLFSFEVR